MSNRRDKIKNSVLNINKGDTIGPVKGSIDFGPSSGYGEGSFGAPTGAQLEEQFNKKYPSLKPLTIPESFKARKDPHKTPENQRQNDVIATAGAIAMPAGRMEEGIASVIGRIMPAIKKAGPKVMARFSNLLKKAKGNPEALVKISKSLEDIVPMAEGKGFTSRPIGEPSAAQKRKGRNDVKPAYEKGYGKPGSQYPDMAKNYSNKPGEFSSLRNQNPYEKPFDPGWPHDTVYDNPNFKSKKLESLDNRAENLMNKAQRLEEVDYVEGARDLKDMANTSRESVTPAYERRNIAKDKIDNEEILKYQEKNRPGDFFEEGDIAEDIVRYQDDMDDIRMSEREYNNLTPAEKKWVDTTDAPLGDMKLKIKNIGDDTQEAVIDGKVMRRRAGPYEDRPGDYYGKREPAENLLTEKDHYAALKLPENKVDKKGIDKALEGMTSYEGENYGLGWEELETYGGGVRPYIYRITKPTTPPITLGF